MNMEQIDRSNFWFVVILVVVLNHILDWAFKYYKFNIKINWTDWKERNK